MVVSDGQSQEGDEAHMTDDELPTESTRVTAEQGREPKAFDGKRIAGVTAPKITVQ